MWIDPSVFHSSVGTAPYANTVRGDATHMALFRPNDNSICYVSMERNVDAKEGYSAFYQVDTGSTFILPENPYEAPTGMVFSGWRVAIS